MALTQITLTGTYLSPKDNTPASGKVTFTLNNAIQDSAGDVIIAQKVEEVVLDGTGSFSAALIANDSVDASPQGTTYLVDEQLDDTRPRQYQITIPKDAAGGTVDLADLTPAVALDQTFQYALVAHRHAVNIHTGEDDPSLEETNYVQDGDLWLDEGVNPNEFNGDFQFNGSVQLSDGGEALSDLEGDSRYLRVFDVKNYGAVGDGSTNDTTAVQTAIDAAELENGGLVYFPAGSYLINSITVQADGIHLVGAGQWVTTIEAHASMTGHLIDFIEDHCSISNMTLDGNNVGLSVLALDDAGRFRASRLYIRNAGQDGIQVGYGSSQTHAGQYSNIYIDSSGRNGLRFELGGFDSQIENIWVASSGSDGIRLEDGNNSFTNVHSWGSGGDGLRVNSARNRFVNCFLDTNDDNGLRVQDAKDNFFANMHLYRNGANGALIGGSSSRTRLVNSLGYINGQDSTGAGIKLSGTSTDTQIVSSHFYDDQVTKTQDYGIQIDSGASGSIIISCQARDSDQLVSGILDNASDTVFMAVEGVYATIREPLTIIPRSLSDGSELVRLETDRPWAFVQDGTGASTALGLRPDANDKSFHIQMFDGSADIFTARSTGTAGAVGFFGKSPVGKRTLGAAATDAASTQTLANNLRQALIDLGLGQT